VQTRSEQGIARATVYVSLDTRSHAISALRQVAVALIAGLVLADE
jgi:hypothetical protein